MTSRPLLFSASMIRALLDGRKTQTRRLIDFSGVENVLDFVPVGTDAQGRRVFEMKGRDGKYVSRPAGKGLVECQFSPRIAINDLLWVRENYLPDPPSDHPSWHDNVCSYVEWSGCGSRVSDVPFPMRDRAFCIYRADPMWDDCQMVWRPSIHMPRWASRITLIVTDVRVERLQDISEADAIAEGLLRGDPLPDIPDSKGVIWSGGVGDLSDPFAWTRSPISAYRDLWNHINGPGAWDANPWVVAYTFTPIFQNIDQIERSHA